MDALRGQPLRHAERLWIVEHGDITSSHEI
jgi:hypothetical protein